MEEEDGTHTFMVPKNNGLFAKKWQKTTISGKKMQKYAKKYVRPNIASHPMLP